MRTLRPTCAHCGNAYGQRAIQSEQVKWPAGEPMPEYRGNGIVLKTSKPYASLTRAAVRGVTMLSVNPTLRALQEKQLATVPEQSFSVATRDIWDGESWRGGYKPFCTKRCALDYARKAFKKHGPIR